MTSLSGQPSARATRIQHERLQGRDAHHLKRRAAAAAQYRDLVALLADGQAHHQADEGQDQADDGDAEGIKQDRQQARGRLRTSPAPWPANIRA